MVGPSENRVVVIAASVAYDGLQLSEQHLALALAARHEVLYLDPPRAVWRRGAGWADSRPSIVPRLVISDIAPRLTRASFAVPPGFRHPRVQPLFDRWRTRLVCSLLAGRGQQPAAILSAAGRPSIFTGYGEARKVLWAKDDYVVGAGLLGLDAERLMRAQEATRNVVDAVIAVTPGLREHWSSRVRETALIPAGADTAMSAAVRRARPASDVRLPGPIAGFVGQLSDRIDFEVLESVADTGASVLLVGGRHLTFGAGDRLTALSERPNVQWVGGRTYAQLPEYLAAIDVGLLPYTESPFNRASFPLKLLEYLAGGAAVVSSDLPGVRWLCSPHVTVSAPSGFAESVRHALARAGEPDAAQLREARMLEAAQHSWAARAAEAARVLGLPS